MVSALFKILEHWIGVQGAGIYPVDLDEDEARGPTLEVMGLQDLDVVPFCVNQKHLQGLIAKMIAQYVFEAKDIGRKYLRLDLELGCRLIGGFYIHGVPDGRLAENVEIRSAALQAYGDLKIDVPWPYAIEQAFGAGGWVDVDAVPTTPVKQISVRKFDGSKRTHIYDPAGPDDNAAVVLQPIQE